MSISKIKEAYAIEAAHSFVTRLHLPPSRGLIASFNAEFRIEQDFTSAEPRLHTAIDRLANCNSGTTRLYDSIADLVQHFWDCADRRRPWLIVTVTDGMDNESLQYKQAPARLGTYIAEHYNHEPSNFMALVGVGTGREIDLEAMAKVGRYGGFPVTTIEGFRQLEAVMLDIVYDVKTSLIRETTHLGPYELTEQHVRRELSMIPMDYALLIDRSGSMGEPANR